MTWTIKQFSQPVPIEFGESLFDNNVLAAALIATMVICISYNLIHRILTSKSASYNKLNKETQLVVTQHAIEAIILSLFFVPHTWLMLNVNFEQQDPASIKLNLQMIATSSTFIMIMYLVELATRHRHLRPLVAAHHVLASINIYLGVQFPETAFLKGGSILTHFIMYESVTFIGLVMYRLYPKKQITPRIITAGIFLFAISRPVQLIWILASLAVAWEHLVMWQGVVQVLFAFTFTVLQLYSLKIHASIRKRCIEKQEKEEQDAPDEEMDIGVSMNTESEEASASVERV